MCFHAQLCSYLHRYHAAPASVCKIFHVGENNVVVNSSASAILSRVLSDVHTSYIVLNMMRRLQEMLEMAAGLITEHDSPYKLLVSCSQ